MEFQLNPVIRDSGSLQEFFARWSVGSRDLIITNEYLVKPYLAGKKRPVLCCIRRSTDGESRRTRW